MQDASLLDVWGDADAKKGNTFSHIFTSKVSWVAAQPDLRLLVRLLKVGSKSYIVLQCHALSPHFPMLLGWLTPHHSPFVQAFSFVPRHVK